MRTSFEPRGTLTVKREQSLGALGCLALIILGALVFVAADAWWSCWIMLAAGWAHAGWGYLYVLSHWGILAALAFSALTNGARRPTK